MFHPSWPHSSPRDHTGAMSEHSHEADSARSEELWNERYLSAAHLWSSNPNPQLLAEVADLEPGLALDVGCGEGADAVWLAQRGWQVVATDISGVAIERASEHVRSADPSVAARVEWRQVDLLVSAPEPDTFDLVSVQFMHLPPELRTQLFTSLASSVRSGGTLLVVGHHPSDLLTGVRRPSEPELLYTADDVAKLLGPSWTVVVSDSRPRLATTPDGVEVTVHDAVLRAVRHDATRSSSSLE